MLKILPYLIGITTLLIGCSNNKKQYFTDKSTNFKILFPGKPTGSDQTIAFPFGSFTGKKFSLETTSGMNNSYTITCIELPGNMVNSDSLNLLSQLFALTQLDYLKQIGEQGLLNTWIKNTDKYPGREFVWNDPKNNMGYTRRVFLVKNMLYLLEVTYPSSNQHNTDIGSFLNSFRLLQSTTNPHPEPMPKVPERKFELSFPETPISRKQVIQGAKGPEYIATEMFQTKSPTAFDESGNSAYGINYMNFSNDTVTLHSTELSKKFIYDNSSQNPLIINGGEVLELKESTIDGHWCLQMKAIVLNGKFELLCKTFFIDDYLFQVMILSAPGKSNNSAAQKFMDSFHYKK